MHSICRVNRILFCTCWYIVLMWRLYVSNWISCYGTVLLEKNLFGSFARYYFYTWIFLDPRPRLEESYKLGSVRSSFLQSVSFLKIGSLVCITELDFLEKISIGQKWSKMAHKHGFWTFKKITSLVLYVICKMKVLMVH